MKKLTLLSLAAITPIAAHAQLFSENFDVDHTANWTVRTSPTTDTNANFFFDYSTLGIPSANGSGGTTRGLRMLANQSSGVFGGLSVSPNGQSFTGDYTITADVWLNFVGPAPVGGSGSTQLAGMGLGTSGNSVQWAGGTQDSVWFGTTTDGNSSSDYRAYSSAAPTRYADGSPVYSAPSTNASHTYYSSYFPGSTPPAAQTALYPNQTGTALTGTTAFGWHKWKIVKQGNFATWTIDTLQIASVDLTTVTLGGTNFHLNYMDTNSTSSTDPNDFLTHVIYDNVQVVPEPATMAVLGLGVLPFLRRRKK